MTHAELLAEGRGPGAPAPGALYLARPALGGNLLVEEERPGLVAADRAAIRVAALGRELAHTTANEQTVLAPCTGTVGRLGARAAGAVVQEGDLLAEEACAGVPLHAELTVPRDGFGRLRPGLGTKLLYDAYPYQRHGVRQGTVRWVSPASVSTDRTGTFRAHRYRDPRRRPARPLLAGMTGCAEIVVGRHALITYAFEPLRQLRENLAGVPEARAAAPWGLTLWPAGPRPGS